MQVAEETWPQLDSTGHCYLQCRGAGFSRRHPLNNHNLICLDIFQPDELNVMLLSHYVGHRYSNVIPGDCHLRQMLGRIAVSVRFVDLLK